MFHSLRESIKETRRWSQLIRELIARTESGQLVWTKSPFAPDDNYITNFRGRRISVYGESLFVETAERERLQLYRPIWWITPKSLLKAVRKTQTPKADTALTNLLQGLRQEHPDA